MCPKCFLATLPLTSRSIFLLFLFSGCAFLPLESNKVPQFSSRAGPSVPLSDYREAVGVLHVHSRYSDGQFSVERIAETANRQGLDFLILTDHNTLEGRRQGKAGRYGRTLLLIDEEISTAAGHCLALRLPEEVKSRENASWTLQEIRRRGGLSFIAHPFRKQKPWDQPEIEGITGLEIYNGVEDVSDENPAALILATLFLGSAATLPGWLDRPDRELALWDRRLARGERLVGIGSSDAHGLTVFGLHLGPYSSFFKLVRDHLLVKGGELSEQSIYEAIEQGHLFVAHDLIADARGFLFAAVRPGGQVAGILGDRVKREPGLRFYVSLPAPGEMILFRDGQEVGRSTGREGWFEIAGPGVYRLEARHGGRPWIYSNPIYVLEWEKGSGTFAPTGLRTSAKESDPLRS